MGLFGGKPAAPAPKPTPQKRQETIREENWRMNRETALGKNTIPGAGGKKWGFKEFKDTLKKRAPYEKFGTSLDIHEKIRIMKNLRKEDGGNLMSGKGRLRREFEENWGLKSGRDY